jgi:hypothetical protein
MKKNLFKAGCFVVVAFLLCGCDSTSTTQNSSSSSSALSTSVYSSSNYDLEAPEDDLYKVTLENKTTVKIDFAHKSDQSKSQSNVEYKRIMADAPISTWKIEEGDASPDRVDRIRLYTYENGVTEDYKATTQDSRYAEVRILRKNYTETEIVSTPVSEPADVVFLRKKDGSTQNIVYFDIYLRSDKTNKLASVSKVLEKCQSDPSTIDPEAVEEAVMLGASDIASDEVALKKQQAQREYRKNNPPEGVGPIPKTATAVEKIKNISGNNTDVKKALIAQVFNLNNADSQLFEPFYLRDSSVVLDHASDLTDSINLNKEILNIQSGELFDSASEIKMIFLKTSTGGIAVGSYGSPMVQIKAAGKDYYYGPSQYRTEYVYTNSTDADNNLGVSSFEPVKKPLEGDPWCGFTPESKPAIYLYPKYPTIVNVKVDTSKGWMTKSIPEYPDNGWRVLAMPSGKIFSGFKTYTHLFYETMLPSPSIGENYEVIAADNLTVGLKDLALRLSLSEEEATDLADYWTTNLPNAKYYKVGLMNGSNIDALEPLDISPAPNSLYRVRLVFKATNEQISSTTRFFGNFDRNGFSVVDWGGFVL